MPDSSPSPISGEEHRRRLHRIGRLVENLAFQGKVEYRHVISGTGGAQYGIGSTQDDDLLVVFAEAFERDADPDDFSLDAILAHERGHQLLIRSPNLLPISRKRLSGATEEMLASLIGSIIAEKQEDRQLLYYKALYDALGSGMASDHAVQLLHELRVLLEEAL